MKKFLISEEEKIRILNLHEGFKKELLKEQVSGDTSGTTIGAPVSGWTPNNDIKPRPKSQRPPKPQAYLDWMGTGSTAPDITTGPVIGKVYSTTIMNWNGIQEPVTFDMKVKLRKSAEIENFSWFGYEMWIYDVKSGKGMDLLEIDCKTVSTYINNLKSNKEWSQLDHFNSSQYKWYFNIQFLNDLYQTLGCK